MRDSRFRTMKNNKDIQKDSLAALRIDTLGFGLMPMRGYDFLAEPGSTGTQAISDAPELPALPALDWPQTWATIRHRFRRWKRVLSGA